MLTTTISFMISIIIPMIIMIMASTLSKKMINDREKSSPFECGFDPKSPARMPFSIQFFLIAVIFLIFDVEIVLFLPLMLIFKYSNLMSWSISTMTFLLILLGGLYFEWKQGALKWAE
uniref:NADH-ubiquinone oxidoreductase chain 3 n=1 Tax=Ochrophlegma sp. TAMUIC IGC OR279 TaxID=2591245 RepID=A0A516IMS9_9ORTH|nr:NADH dehydrogenase subunit 3 [Ochrophlegma sp. TAMUIC IGC OR279]